VFDMLVEALEHRIDLPVYEAGINSSRFIVNPKAPESTTIFRLV